MKITFLHFIFPFDKRGRRRLYWPWWPWGKARLVPSAQAEADLRSTIKAGLLGFLLFSVLMGTVGAVLDQFGLWVFATVSGGFFVAVMIHRRIRPWPVTEVKGPGLRGYEEALASWLPWWVILAACLGLAILFFSLLSPCFSENADGKEWTWAAASLLAFLEALRLLGKKITPKALLPIQAPSFKDFLWVVLPTLILLIILLAINAAVGSPWNVDLDAYDLESWKQWGFQMGFYALAFGFLWVILRLRWKSGVLDRLGIGRVRPVEIALGALVGTSLFLGIFLIHNRFLFLFKCYGLGMGMVLAAAWIEEIWFRGLALPGLVKLLGPFGSVFLTSLVFGLMHADDLTGAEYRHAVLLGCVGLGNGLLYWWTKRLNASITAHAVYNFWVVAGAFYIWLMPVQFPQALCFGAQYWDAGRIEKLIDRGADLEASPDGWNTPFQTAAVHGRVDVMKLLVKHGANPFAATTNGVDAYLMAASKGQTGPVTYLLDLGEKIDTATDTGETALMAAALDGRVNVVELLLKRGADPNLLDKSGESALYRAVSKKHWYTARFILERGGKPDLKGATVGATPLSYSVYFGNADTVQLMLKYGADPNIVSDKGLSVFQKAVYWDKKEMLRLLLAESRKRPNAKQLEALEYYARAHSGLEMDKLVRSFEGQKAGKRRPARR